MKLRIRELRQAKGVTQEELAERSGISRATIWALETNTEKVTTTKTLLSIAGALDVPVDDLFFDDDA